MAMRARSWKRPLFRPPLRRRNALRSRKGATPAAAAAAAVAAVPVEEYHWYNADAAGDDEAEGFEPRLVSCGRARFGMKDYGVADGWGEDFAGDADDAVEIPVVDELSDTGELYDVEEFNRLLAEDAALAAEAGEADRRRRARRSRAGRWARGDRRFRAS